MKKLAKGFTLIELMIVVAIICILAAIAIPNFIKYQLRSKFSESSSNIEGLRKAEESLRQGERNLAGVATTNYVAGQYWDLGATPLPTGTVGTAKIAWNAPNPAMARTIDWQVEGATHFQYQVAAALRRHPRRRPVRHLLLGRLHLGHRRRQTFPLTSLKIQAGMG